jgi:hypothetical protein
MSPLRTTLPLSLLLVVVTPLPSAEPDRKRAEEIARLIKQLGSDSFEEREEATKKLSKMDDALPALRKAAKSDDAEVQQRAERLAEEIGKRVEELELEKMFSEVGKNGFALDRFIDEMVHRKGFATEKRWELTVKLAQAIAEQASKESGREFKAPALDVSKLATVTDLPRGTCSRSRVLANGNNRRVSVINGCVMVVSGPIDGVGILRNSIVFLDGNLTRVIDTIENSIIFCDGDIDGNTIIRNSILIGNGELKASFNAEKSCFQLRSIRAHTTSRDNVYFNMNEVEAIRVDGAKYVKTERGPMQLFKFFDPSSFGAEFRADDKGVQVGKILAGKAYDKAGLKEGDRILRLEDAKIESLDDLRKLLRRKRPKEDVEITILRGNKETKIKLHIPE